MKKLICGMVLFLCSSLAYAMPISGNFGGLGYFNTSGEDPTVYNFPMIMADYVNTGLFAGISNIQIGEIFVTGNTATANPWLIGSHSFIVDDARVFNRDAGLDFLLKGELHVAGAQESSPFKVLMETIPNGPNRGMVIFARVPEPGSIVLLCIGLAGLVMIRQRKALPTSR